MRADPLVYVLASSASATGSAVAIRGGDYLFMAEGTVGGSTISLQIQTPNGTWVDVATDGASASIVKSTTLPFACSSIRLPAGNVRVAATGGTPSALFAYLAGIG